MISNIFLKFNGKIDRRSPDSEGEPADPIVRENMLARNGKLSTPGGTERAISNLSDIPRWSARYYTVESGAISPKTFVYTQDGKLWVLDDLAGTATEIKSLLNTNAYPNHWFFKTQTQTKLYLVDGKNLYKYDGNNDNKFEIVTFTDTSGNSVEPIDVIEHLDRLILISKTFLYISKNLDPDVFNSATDSLAVIVGSGKGTNLALGKIEDKLYILNTEGIFSLRGDVISALASTFEVKLVEERKIIATGSRCKVEKALLFVADDYELWSWDGIASEMLSYAFMLKDFINPNRDMLNKMVSTYFNNYYMLSFVEKGQGEPNIELWWDAFENKIDIVRGRKISCYMHTDPTIETGYLQTGRSDRPYIMYADRGYNFDGEAIVKRLRSRDVTLENGTNGRIVAFYPKIEPIGNRNIQIMYHLDGRSSMPAGSGTSWSQNLRGETKGVGLIQVKNQEQFTDRVRPKINYARGESIAFEINDSTKDLRLDLIGIGIDYIVKLRKKKKAIGA